jgi:hypothetical protein
MSEHLNLSLSNVVNVTVLGAPSGLGLPNINTLCLFSSETAGETFGAGDYKIYKGPSDVATDFGSSSKAYDIALAIFSQNPNILTTGGYLVIVPRSGGTEKVQTACARVIDQVYFFGVLVDVDITGGTDFVDMTAYMQTIDKVLFFGSATGADIVSTTGRFDVARLAGKTHSRCLYYTVDQASAVLMTAAYAGRALSTAFSGSLTCQTMHLKGLATIDPDSGITQSILNTAKAAGADTYVSIAGVPGVFCSGENVFFDEIYNELWMKSALQVAGFNYLRQTNSKIPQTEVGMDGLKNAYRAVCQQAVVNGFLAPGSWTSPDSFGSREALVRCIKDIGFYVYSEPISLQDQDDREDRIAPLIQIACKAAGAVHSSDIIVTVNA